MERLMEMVKAKVAVLAALALVSCSRVPLAYDWEKFGIDGHRTGVTVPAADNIPQALGTISPDGTYNAPNGRVFKGGSTPEVASLLMEVQPGLAALKEVVAISPQGLSVYPPESPLSNFIVDNLARDVAEITGKKVDVGIVNFGGIRCNLPAGNVLLDDVVSMLPFKNYGTWLSVKGTDLRAFIEQLAAEGPQCVSGARVVVKDGKLESVLIGGKPLDDNKYYGVATIDFLLDGGDNIRLARNARQMIITDWKLGDLILADIRELKAAGKPLEYGMDGRFVVEGADRLSRRDPFKAEPYSGTVPSRKPRLVVIHCNDTHSHFDPFLTGEGVLMGGIIERAAFVDSIRAAYPASKVLFLHAGDFNQGTSYYSELGGSLEPKMINAMKYDCITLGNHELDDGIESLAERLSVVDCPVVCANCEFPAPLSSVVEPYTIIKRGGMKIGIIGLESDIATMVSATIADRVQQIDNVTAVMEWAPYLKHEEKCDMVILLSHIGYSEDLALIPRVRDVDLVVGGHSHTFVDGLASAVDLDGKTVPVITDGCWGQEMGLVKVY